ncbi:MAG: isoprenylcysteine carboxylmethyltransferase family protein [Candidatus Acidiferrum sp.]
MTAASICSYLWILLLVIWLAAWGQSKRTQERQSIGSSLLHFIPFVLAFPVMFHPWTRFPWLQRPIVPSSQLLGVLSVALTVFGVATALWARLSLGKNWSGAVTIKVGHQLIRKGPYAWVRHPIYTGLLLAMVGMALARNQLCGVFAVALLWLGMWLKSRNEERLMLKTFGAQYEDYRRTTGALIPRIHS